MAAAMQKYMDKLDEFKSLPEGERFTISVTDQEATQAAKEFLAENPEDVKQMIQKTIGTDMDVSDPVIFFRKDEVVVSACGKKGFLKVNAGIIAKVLWNNGLNANVKSVKVPVIQVTPEKLNFLITDPFEKGMAKVREYAVIRSVEVTDGVVILDAEKK